jgi:hypothetical protein
MGFEQTHHHVNAFSTGRSPFKKHPVGLPYTGCHPNKNLVATSLALSACHSLVSGTDSASERSSSPSVTSST